MKQLTLTVTANSVEKWEQTASCRPPMIVARAFEVVFDFCLRLNGRKARSLSVRMSASDRGQNDERLRDELIQSAYPDRQIHADALNEKENDFDDMSIEIIDPHGVLKWFGLDQAADIFNKHQSNDKPVRLIAPATR